MPTTKTTEDISYNSVCRNFVPAIAAVRVLMRVAESDPVRKTSVNRA